MPQPRSPGVSCLGIIGVLVTWSSLTVTVLAQVVPDSSLGTERSQVTRSTVQGTPAELIQGGAQRGTNLFHSFSDFNVGDRQRVYFANPTGVLNILSRVTGSSPSNILGTLGVNGSANLFVINPNGILFGPNARLDIRGSFLASTADSLQFDNGFLFSASNPQAPPLLTVNVPIGLQFGPNPGGIRLQGVKQTDLRVGIGQTLALVGGEILLDGGSLAGSPPLRCPDPSCAPRVLEGGGLTTPGGRIELGSVAAGSLVAIAPASSGWQLGYQNVEQFQDIRLSRAARVEASGSGGGSIQVQGRQITLTNGSQIVTLTRGTQTGGNLTVRASELVELVGFDPSTGSPSRIANESTPGSTGNSGNLMVETQNFRLVNGAVMSSGTSGAGNGGNLTVRAKLIEVIGNNPQLRLPSSLVNQVGQGSTGNGGNLTIETETLRVLDNGSISVGTFAAGNGGNLTVQAKSIEIIGSLLNPQRGPSSTLVAQAFRGSTGNAGDITLITDRLQITQGSVRAASVESGSAGNIAIQANSQIVLTDNGRINASTINGQGNITLTTPLLLMRRNSSITTNATGNGTGGNITINADFIVSAPNENNDIIANAFAGSGGQIRISAQGLFWFNLRTRQELQRLLNATDPVDLDPRRLPTNDITAFSQANPTIDTGAVRLQTPDLDPTQGLTALPTDLTDPSQLIASTCPVDQGSSFAITGRGGLPEDPRQPLIGQVIWQDDRQVGENGATGRGESGKVEQSNLATASIVEAQDWIVDSMGTFVLVARQSSTSQLAEFGYPTCALSNLSP